MGRNVKRGRERVRKKRGEEKRGGREGKILSYPSGAHHPQGRSITLIT